MQNDRVCIDLCRLLNRMYWRTFCAEVDIKTELLIIIEVQGKPLLGMHSLILLELNIDAMN